MRAISKGSFGVREEDMIYPSHFPAQFRGKLASSVVWTFGAPPSHHSAWSQTTHSTAHYGICKDLRGHELSLRCFYLLPLLFLASATPLQRLRRKGLSHPVCEIFTGGRDVRSLPRNEFIFQQTASWVGKGEVDE